MDEFEQMLENNLPLVRRIIARHLSGRGKSERYSYTVMINGEIHVCTAVAVTGVAV